MLSFFAKKNVSHVGGFSWDEYLHSQRVHLRGTKVSPCVRWGVSSSRGSQAAVGEVFVAGADFFIGADLFLLEKILLQEQQVITDQRYLDVVMLF